MLHETPAQLSYDIVRQISLFKRTKATSSASQHVRHLRFAHFCEFDAPLLWNLPADTPLATTPADLSCVLLDWLFKGTGSGDLVALSQDDLPGSEVTYLPSDAWPLGNHLGEGPEPLHET